MKKLLIATLLLSGCHSYYPSRGLTGYQGAVGAPGVDGSPGVSCTVSQVPSGALIECPTSQALVYNGTLVKPVQFCPGTPTYPSKFIENGFVIGNTLYAVYSANGGFMAAIPPGYYTSNGIGSSCNFTVNADLTVSN